MVMDLHFRESCFPTNSEEEMELKKGPWTAEEDSLLFNYVSIHGEGHWNFVACSAGLKRSGKSCRLRWLNYLRPNVRRGNITLEEQLLILQLHSRWGNRWSKIAQYLPGRTDNEIKNYWRTRVQKQAKQLNCDVNSQQFRDTMRYVWIPRLMERISASSSQTSMKENSTASSIEAVNHFTPTKVLPMTVNRCISMENDPNVMADGASPDSFDTQISDLTDCNNNKSSGQENVQLVQSFEDNWSSWDMQSFEPDMHACNFELSDGSGFDVGDLLMDYSLWNCDDGNNQSMSMFLQP